MQNTIYIVLIVASSISTILLLRHTSKKINELEALIKRKGVGHTMINGKEMHTAVFYFGLFGAHPDWASNDQDSSIAVLGFKVAFICTIISGCACGFVLIVFCW